MEEKHSNNSKKKNEWKIKYVKNNDFRELLTKLVNRIGGVMVSVLVWSVTDCGLEPNRVKPKTIKLVHVFVVSVS